jgi:hypothetical protein
MGMTFISLNAAAGKNPEEYGTEPVRYDEMIPGCWEPEARLVDMDVDGVWGALCFPSFPEFAVRRFSMLRTEPLHPMYANAERLRHR